MTPGKLKPGAAIGSVLAATILVGAPTTSLAQTASVDAAQCPAERAVYEMRTTDSDDVWRLGLVPARNMASMASNLYLRLTTPQRNYWFTFAVAQGYGGMSVLPVTDPYIEPGPRDLLAGPDGDQPDAATVEDVGGWLQFIALDAELNAAADPPSRGDAAPHYLLLPEIGKALWYAAATFTEDTTADRDPMPVGVFKRTDCLAAAPPPALP